MSVPAISASQSSTEPQQPASWVSRVFRWCLPNRVDGLVLLCAAMVLVAFAEPVVQTIAAWMGSRHDFNQLGLAFIAVAGCVAAIAVTAGLGRLKLNRGIILIGACLLALGALAFATFQLNTAGTEAYFGQREGRTFPVIGPGAVKFWFTVLIGGLLVGFAAFMFTWTVAWLFKRIATQSGYGNFTRSKVLVAAAVVLFIVGTIQNIFFPSGFLAGAQGNRISVGGPAIQMIAMVVLGLIAAIVLLVLPCHLLTRSGSRRWKILTVLSAGVLGVLVLIFQQMYFSMYSSSQRLVETLLVFETFFLWSAVLACKDGVPVAAEAPRNRRTTLRSYPSVWSLFIVAVVVAIGSVISLFDLPSLVTSKGQNWEAARLVKSVARSSDRQLSVIPNWGGFQVICKFDENTDPNVLDVLDQKLLDLPIVSGHFEGLSPAVSTKRLRGKLTSQVSLMNCQVTSDQLNDLASSSVAYTSLTNVDVVDPSASVKIGMAGTCTIARSEGGRFGSLLQAVAPSENGNIRLYKYTYAFLVGNAHDRSCDQTELDAIVDLSQRISVTIDGGIFDDFVESDFQPKMSMQNVIVEGMGSSSHMLRSDEEDGHATSHLAFIFKNDLFLDHGATDDQHLFWNLAFAKNEAANPYYVERISKESLSNASVFRENSDQFHWKFGENEKQEVTELFLPNGELAFDQLDLTNAEIGHFSSVETLSFDPLWLNRPSPAFNSGTIWRQRADNHVYLTNLGALPKLKRLDLGLTALASDQTFLNCIPNIEHLQIGLEESIKPLVDFSVCKNLKTLVYFGTPPKITTMQLAKLSNLDSVTFVDGGDLEFVGEPAIKNLENSIPGVKVKIVMESEYVPDRPESFKKHVQEKVAEIKAIYLD